MRKIAYFCVLLSIGILGLCGCSLAPKYKQPPLPVASTYPGDASVMTNDRVVANIAWRDYFADPYMQKLITQALESSRDLQTAVLRVGEAQALYRVERANQFPNINADFDINRGHVPSDLSIASINQTVDQYRIGFSLASWELDFWGRVRNLKKVALENFLATDAARRAATVSLIARVAENYLVLRGLDERLILVQQTIANHQKSFLIFSKRFKVGAISRLELSQVETLLTQAQALGTQLEQARAAEVHNLTLLVGSPIIPPPRNMRFEDNIVPHKLRVGLPSELLTVRPDIVAAEHQLRADGANIGAARANFFPRITLTGSFGSASNELSGLFEGGSKVWNYAPKVFLPIFDAGRNRANFSLAKVRRDMAVANYEKTIQTAFREVSDALSARYWLSRQVRIQQRMVAAESERARLAELRYDNGAAPYLEVLDAQRDLLSAKQQLAQTRRALQSSYVRLYAALGGGSQTYQTSYIHAR